MKISVAKTIRAWRDSLQYNEDSYKIKKRGVLLVLIYVGGVIAALWYLTQIFGG